MLDEERAAWEDAYRESLHPISVPAERERGWYVTVGLIAAGLMALWVLYN